MTLYLKIITNITYRTKLEFNLILKIKVDCDEGIFEGKNVCDGADCGTWTCELVGEGMCSVIIDHNL